jgi:hypothetical protein
MNLFKAVGCALLAMSLAGCVSYRGLRLVDHPTKEMTLIEVEKNSFYGLAASSVRQYYECTDRADQLDCKLVCDGTSDLQCPSSSAGSGFGHNNVR